MVTDEDLEYANQNWPWYIKLKHWLFCHFGGHLIEEAEWIAHGRAFCLHCKQWISRN